MKKLLRKLAIKFFSKYIKTYQIFTYVSDVEILYNKNPLGEYHKKEMAFRMADLMVREGLIEFTREDDVKKMGVNFRAKIRVI